MSFYNTTDAPFNADKLDAIIALDKIGMLDRKTAIALLGGDPREVKPNVITRNGESNLPTEGTLRHEATMRKAATKKVVRKDVKKPVHHVVNGQAVPTPKAARKAEPKAGTGATIALAPNWNGQMMPADAGTLSSGQARWLKANTKKSDAIIAKLSMVDASNLRAKLTGKA